MYLELRFAAADWVSKDRTIESLRTSLNLADEGWGYYQELAEVSPPDALVALGHAVEINPTNYGLWLELAATEEKLGKLAAAETHLIRAVELDKSSSTRTLLAEFYFRHHQTNLFWLATRAVFDIASVLPESLFKDCWLLTSDASFILQQIIPDRPAALFQYLQFLLTENRLDAAHSVAVCFMSQPCCSAGGMMNATSVRGLFTDYVNQLLLNNKAEDAVTTWNWLSARKLIPNEPLIPADWKWIVNGGFRNTPSADTSNGLDWRAGSSEGVLVDFLAQGRGMKITLTGRQPEHCEILSEYVILQPLRYYHLHITYSTSVIDDQPGLAWHVVTPTGEDLLSHDPANVNGAIVRGIGTLGSKDKEQKFAFDGPAQLSVARLVFAYDRLLGTVRTDGIVEIRKVDGTFE